VAEPDKILVLVPKSEYLIRESRL